MATINMVSRMVVEVDMLEVMGMAEVVAMAAVAGMVEGMVVVVVVEEEGMAAEVAVVMVHNMVRKKRYQLVPIKLVNQSDMMQSKLKL